MKVETNRTTQTPQIKLEDSDAMNILDLRNLIHGHFSCQQCGFANQNRGWEYLKGYFASLRLWVEEMGKSHAQSRAKKDLCDNDFSILTGMDMAIGLPERIIRQSDMMDKIREQKLLEEVASVEEGED